MVGRQRRKSGELNHSNAGIHDVTSGKLLIFFLPFSPPEDPPGWKSNSAQKTPPSPGLPLLCWNVNGRDVMGQDSSIPTRPGLSGSGWGARNSGGTFSGLRVSLTAVIIARLDTSLCCDEHGRSQMEIRDLFQVLSEDFLVCRRRD